MDDEPASDRHAFALQLEQIKAKLERLERMGGKIDAIADFLVARETAPDLFRACAKNFSLGERMSRELSRTPYLLRDLKGLFASFAVRSVADVLSVESPECREEGEDLLRRAIEGSRAHRSRCYEELQKLRWRDLGADAVFFELCRAAESESGAWEYLGPRFWLRHIAGMLQTGDRTGASRLLETYTEKHGDKHLEDYFPVAHLARERGMVNAAIAITAEVFEAMTAEDRALRDAVAGKRVAVVCNGPQERGSGNGAVIDGHDLVLRVNVFPQNDAYADDYGRRTDIWAVLAGMHSLDQLFVSRNGVTNSPAHFKGETALYLDSIWHADEEIAFANAKYFQALLTRGCCVGCIPSPVDLAMKQSLHHPSSGFKMLFWLKQVLPDFPRTSAFGCFLNPRGQDAPDLKKHYFGTIKAGGGYRWHDLSHEREILLPFFASGSLPGGVEA